jgi:tRNA(His) 5'-end guanylyltransferase
MNEMFNNTVNPIELKGEWQKYKATTDTRLKTKVPVFVFVDGNAFSTLTKHFRKPYDEVFSKTMQQTMKYLCEEIQGCVFGYTVSDEITLILTDYHKWNSCPWFDYRVKKVGAIAASKASVAFNKFFKENKEEFYISYDGDDKEELYRAYNNALDSMPVFDGSCFNVPEDRVCEMILWRQYDARRNSIQSLGRKYFSNREMLGKSNGEVLEMLSEKNVSWPEMPTAYRIGSCCSKGVEPFARKKKWKVDSDMPMLCDENRKYLQDIMDSVRSDCIDD